MTGHTPGPWHYRRSMWGREVPCDGFGIYSGDRKRQICGNNQNDPGDGVEPFMAWSEMGANARLIAAVPTLLNALGRLLNDSMYKDHPEASQMAIDAIIEATGKHPGDR